MPQKRKIVSNNISTKNQKTVVKSPPMICRQNAFNLSTINNDNSNNK